jgi:hypothetical protein
MLYYSTQTDPAGIFGAHGSGSEKVLRHVNTVGLVLFVKGREKPHQRARALPALYGQVFLAVSSICVNTLNDSGRLLGVPDQHDLR